MSHNGECHWLNTCATKQFERYLICINHVNDHQEQCERFLLRGILCDKSYQKNCPTNPTDLSKPVNK